MSSGPLQESAKEIKDMCNQANKQMTPLVQKYILGRTTSSSALLNSQAGQQVDNLVWQQEMFHRVLKLQGLVREGLLQEMELRHCRKEILTGVAAEHPNGEWTDFTRDKLLFLQVRLFVWCCIPSNPLTRHHDFCSGRKGVGSLVLLNTRLFVCGKVFGACLEVVMWKIAQRRTFYIGSLNGRGGHTKHRFWIRDWWAKWKNFGLDMCLLGEIGFKVGRYFLVNTVRFQLW